MLETMKLGKNQVLWVNHNIMQGNNQVQDTAFICELLGALEIFLDSVWAKRFFHLNFFLQLEKFPSCIAIWPWYKILPDTGLKAGFYQAYDMKLLKYLHICW